MTTYRRIAALLLFLTLGAPETGRGQAKSPEQLGKVDFPNSCAPECRPVEALPFDTPKVRVAMRGRCRD